MASSRNLPSTSRQPSYEKICLETHTWHEEHFHMGQKWGYKIPHYLNGTNITVSYKAITENCLLQDISYYTCIEIVGEKNSLEATLKKHCNPKKTFAEKMYTNGEREGTVMFFKRNGYPRFPVGYVNFIWKLSETNIKTIWMWVHPAFYIYFLDEIIHSFKFKQNNAEQGRTDILLNLNDLCTNDAGCEMRVLKYALNRFRLSGPAALTVLKEVLHVPSLSELDFLRESCSMTEELDSSVIDEEATKDLIIQHLKKKMWHTKYYKKRKNIEACKIQEDTWKSMNVLESPSSLQSNMIIGLTVLDPRFFLSNPPKGTKTKIPSSDENLHSQLLTDLSRSPIWDAQIRQIVSSSYVSENTIDKLERGMSDDSYFNRDTVAKIPILLIQKPAAASSNLGSRIDIIIPSRWAMAFWMALLTQSPLVGGLRESKLIVHESLQTYEPDFNDPDTLAYTREESKRKKKLTAKYFSCPPDQRFNFIKFGIRSPFFCDWRNLIKGWSDVENFYVLRCFSRLADLKNQIKTYKHMNTRSKSTVQESEFDFQKFDNYKNCLVQVKFSMVSEGDLKEFAIICLPTHEDMRRLEINEHYEGPVEKCHPDPNEKSRERFHKVRSMQLKRLSRHGVKRKKGSQDKVLPEKFDDIHVFNRAKQAKYNKIISDHAKEMRKLDPPESTEVRHSCDRNVMGYVTRGFYSIRRRKRIGIGYVALPSLFRIIRRKSDIVLVRNTKELQYRFARLKILIDKYAS